jgi:predicted nucleic acid-binding protein
VSGIKFLLDTNLVLGLLQGNVAAIDCANSAGLSLAHAGISQISRMELLGFAGISDREQSAIEALLVQLQVLSISPAVESETIALRRTKRIKLPDAIIAATAIANDLQVLTLDKELSALLAQPIDKTP